MVVRNLIVGLTALAAACYLVRLAAKPAPPSPKLGLIAARDDTELPEVTIPILGPARRIRGLGDPRRLEVDLGVSRRVSADLLEPRRLTLHLPDGRSIKLIARSMSVTGWNGVVSDVYVRRPLEPVRFGKAVDDLRQTMKELGIKPDRVMTEHMAGWPADVPGVGEGVLPYVWETGSPAFDDIGIHVRVSPDPKGGWYYLMIFGAEQEARDSVRAIHRLTTFTGFKSDGRALIGPRRKSRPNEPGEGLPDVAVTLPGVPDQVRGMQLSEADHKLSLYYPHAREPHHLTVELGDGRKLTLDARASALLYEYGIITGLHIRRPMEPAPIGEAVADLRATLKGLGVEPDATMIKQMAAWPADSKGFDQTDDPADFEAGMALSPEVRLTARILADPKGKWFSLLTLNASKDACAAVRKARGIKGPPSRD